MINYQDPRPDPLRRLVRKAAGIIPMSWIRPRLLVGVDRGVFRLSRGRTTFSAWISGLPIIMLTTTGAHSGQPRTLPVLALPEDDHLVLIASNFGLPSNPGWYYNLRAQPNVMIAWKGPRSTCMPASCEAQSVSTMSTKASRPIRGGSSTIAAPQRASS